MSSIHVVKNFKDIQIIRSFAHWKLWKWDYLDLPHVSFFWLMSLLIPLFVLYLVVWEKWLPVMQDYVWFCSRRWFFILISGLLPQDKATRQSSLLVKWHSLKYLASLALYFLEWTYSFWCSFSILLFWGMEMFPFDQNSNILILYGRKYIVIDIKWQFMREFLVSD